jgi:hypothetical protein
MSEILAVSNKHFDKFSTLLWGDVKFKSKKVIVKIKCPKVLKSWNEVYLFKFKIKHLCPVRLLRKLKKLQVRANVFSENSPVFRFESGQLVSKSHFNKFLQKQCQP